MVTEFDEQVRKLVAEVGGDFLSARSLLLFLTENIKNDTIKMQIVTSGTDEQRAELFRQGVVRWHELSQKYFKEVLEGKTEFAKQQHKVIYEQLVGDREVAHG